MFHADDHIRLMGCDTTRSMERRSAKAGVRSMPRAHDVNSFLERTGLSGLVRKRR